MSVRPAALTDRRTTNTEISGIRVPPGCALASLDVRLRVVEDRRAETTTLVGPQHLNQRGQVQGGIYGVIADAAAGWATEAHLRGEGYATTSISGQLLGSTALGDTIRAQAEVTHGGRTTVVCDVRLWREREATEPRLVGVFLCQQLVLGPPTPPVPIS